MCDPVCKTCGGVGGAYVCSRCGCDDCDHGEGDVWSPCPDCESEEVGASEEECRKSLLSRLEDVTSGRTPLRMGWLCEAIDEIVRLQACEDDLVALNVRLRAELRGFAEAAGEPMDRCPACGRGWTGTLDVCRVCQFWKWRGGPCSGDAFGACAECLCGDEPAGGWQQSPRRDDAVRRHDWTRRWPTEPPVCGADDAAADRVDRLRALGNGVVPPQAELAFDTLVRELLG